MDEKGRKMSKSLGNGIDPIDAVEEFGADAMRYTIVNITPLGQNLLLSMDKFNVGARFANKIWNASRYVLMNIEGALLREVPESEMDTADRWIVSMYQETVEKMNRMLAEYRLNDASSLIYEFFWHEFCDWYVEISKLKLYSDDENNRSHAASMLVKILEGCMRLLHPIMPFITEEIWQRIPVEKKYRSIMVSEYPVYEGFVDRESVDEINILKEITYTIRNIRGEMNVPPELKASVIIKELRDTVHEVMVKNERIIMFLTRLESIKYGRDVKKPEGSASAVGNGYEVYLPLEGLIDLDREKKRLARDYEKLKAEIERSRAKLENRNFTDRAPESVVQKEKQRLEQFEENSRRIERLIQSLTLKRG